MSYQIVAVTTGYNGQFSVPGDVSNQFYLGAKFRVYKSTGNDHWYIVKTSSFDGTNTNITILSDIPIYSVDTAAKKFVIEGNYENVFVPGETFDIFDPVSNTVSATYTISSVSATSISYNQIVTEIIVAQAVTAPSAGEVIRYLSINDPTADGIILYGDYVINYTDTAVDGIVVPPLTSDTTSLPITLIGVGKTEYGEAVLENMVKILENFADQTPPSNPTMGQLWFDKTDNLLKVWLGSSWVVSSGITASNTPPPATNIGQLWYDLDPSNDPWTLPQLKIWNGAQWISIAENYLRKTGTSPETVEPPVTFQNDVTTNQNLTVGQDVSVGGNETISGTLTVSQSGSIGTNLNVNSNLTVGGDETIGGTLTVTGDTTLNSGLVVDGDTLVVDNINKRVGINKASPTHTLDVSGTTANLGYFTNTATGTSVKIGDGTVEINHPTGSPYLRLAGNDATSAPEIEFVRNNAAGDSIRLVSQNISGYGEALVIKNSGTNVRALEITTNAPYYFNSLDTGTTIGLNAASYSGASVLRLFDKIALEPLFTNQDIGITIRAPVGRTPHLDFADYKSNDPTIYDFGIRLQLAPNITTGRLFQFLSDGYGGQTWYEFRYTGVSNRRAVIKPSDPYVSLIGDIGEHQLFLSVNNGNPSYSYFRNLTTGNTEAIFQFGGNGEKKLNEVQIYTVYNEGLASLKVGGPGQGDGMIYVGQDLYSYGGGIIYRGDTTNLYIGGVNSSARHKWGALPRTDHITFYRVQNQLHYPVFSVPYNKSQVQVGRIDFDAQYNSDRSINNLLRLNLVSSAAEITFDFDDVGTPSFRIQEGTKGRLFLESVNMPNPSDGSVTIRNSSTPNYLIWLRADGKVYLANDEQTVGSAGSMFEMQQNGNVLSQKYTVADSIGNSYRVIEHTPSLVTKREWYFSGTNNAVYEFSKRGASGSEIALHVMSRHYNGISTFYVGQDYNYGGGLQYDGPSDYVHWYARNNGNNVNLLSANTVGTTKILLQRELNANNNKITNVPDPVNNLDVANKQYVDNNTGGTDTKVLTHAFYSVVPTGFSTASYYSFTLVPAGYDNTNVNNTDTSGSTILTFFIQPGETLSSIRAFFSAVDISTSDLRFIATVYRRDTISSSTIIGVYNSTTQSLPTGASLVDLIGTVGVTNTSTKLYFVNITLRSFGVSPSSSLTRYFRGSFQAYIT